MLFPMQCPSCGREIADNAIVCYRCGAPTAAPAAAGRPSAGHRRPMLWPILLLVALLTGAVVAFMATSRVEWLSAGFIAALAALVVIALVVARARRR